MAKINLLPWRAERRAQRQKEFYGMLGVAAAISVLLALFIWFYYNGQIDGQNERNAFLQGEIAKVDAQITEINALDKQKDRLLARKKVIEELQANRSQMVHLFDSLVRTIPDGVVLTSIKQEGNVLTLQGRSQSNARVSTYMRNLEGSGWMTKPDLSVIEAKAAEGQGQGQSAPISVVGRALPYMFSLKVELANPADPGAAPAADPATAPAAAPAGAATPATSQPPQATTPPQTQGSPAS
ncbi:MULTISPECIES: PilN domain-containing protein [Pseudoxanthomonas]|uniref:Type IV pilus assembly protein PilN n=1 Tax=Pseudoxanthomonas winnipegensis TaxID=2480810 RepID=A0AAW8GB97_9GAMM|nr:MULTISPECIES: PilN domain-containing protein [Pseudoxanthomonas]MDQ1118309.1 type IV pilus assembly protein PilN [Pseudoxanthomonas winnipegensis]MDQ1131490.1 type IV pilus assembly protein PilN [Pseudoxanthomonas winnipegensis]MDR6138492.1 type IV pilus assembly protein PilN [Pseudoxanthomonas sp. SORGH_AS_0997]